MARVNIHILGIRELKWTGMGEFNSDDHYIYCRQESLRRNSVGGRHQYGGGVGRGKHFLPHKVIKRAFKRQVNSTKQLLNAGRGHQAPRKATQLLERR